MTSISKLIVGGFKSIYDRTEIPIAPITFLFGPNSAGKSSILDAIQTLIARLSEPKQTAVKFFDREPSVFFNGKAFKSEVNTRTEVPFQNRPPVSLGAEIEDFASDQLSFPEKPIDGDAYGRALYWALDGSAVTVEISENYFNKHGGMLAIYSNVLVDQVELCSFSSPLVANMIGRLPTALKFDNSKVPYDGRNGTWKDLGCFSINLSHPIFSVTKITSTSVNIGRIPEAAYSDGDRNSLTILLKKIEESARQNDSKFINQILNINNNDARLIIRTNVDVLTADLWHPNVFSNKGYMNSDFYDLWIDAGLDIRDEEINFDLINSVNTLLSAFQILSKGISSSFTKYLAIPEIKGDRGTLTQKDVTVELSEDILYSLRHKYWKTDYELTFLQKYAFWLGIRSSNPPSIFDDILSRLKEREDFVNFNLSSGLFGYRRYEVKSIVKVITTDTLLHRDRIIRSDAVLSYRIQLYLEDDGGRQLDFNEVGSGISYVMPILSSLMGAHRSWIAQPELHLHPSAQCAIGDVFLRAFNRGHYSVVETHSEHILLRVLKRIRQTTNRKDLENDLKCPPEAVCVLYFDPQEDGSTKIKQLRVTRLGDFKDRWPDGFFEERGKELFDE